MNNSNISNSGGVGNDEPGWKAVLKINGACLRAMVGFACGWGLWHLPHGPGSGIAQLFAALFFASAAHHSGLALFEISKFIRWARFRRQGARPKADPMAQHADLKSRGLLK